MRWNGALVVLALAARTEAVDYWVKNGGSDAASGLSPAAAWATLGHAAGVVGPGDTVHVLDGDYQGFHLERSGAPGSPIVFAADGDSVRITADNGTTPDGINLEGASHVVIDGFVVDGRTRAGVRAVLAQDVTVRNCRLGSNGRWGVFTGFVDDVVVEDNEAHHSQVEHGIYVSNSGDRPVIRRNHVHDNHANGIHMNADESQGGDGTISDALVERNVIHGNGAGGGSGINMDGVTGSIVRNNLLYDNHASGVSLYRIDGATGSTGNLVVNNTIVQAADGRWCVNIADGSTGNTVRNNILWNLHAYRGAITIDAASRSGFASDHNAVIGRFSIDGGDSVIDLGDWQALGYDAGSFVAAPAALFLVPGTDFHLLSGAPAVDAGSAASAPAEDVEGNPRPVGAGIDMGAYELQLLECGDGGPDPGEQCGEPGLDCVDPCTSCRQCVCALVTPVCGDGLRCGDEACESDADCAAGETCQDCQCAGPPLCASGIALVKAALRLRAAPQKLSFRGEAVMLLPWQGVDPPANGVHFRVGGAGGAGGVDLVIPGGTGWRTNRARTRWSYRNSTNTVRVSVKNRSAVTAGLLALRVKQRGGAATLPDASSVRAAAVLGAAAECAQITWQPPGGPRPRCDLRRGQLVCR